MSEDRVVTALWRRYTATMGFTEQPLCTAPGRPLRYYVRRNTIGR